MVNTKLLERKISMEFADKLEKLGFTGFGPTAKDKTYYFSKHTEKGNHSYQL